MFFVKKDVIQKVKQKNNPASLNESKKKIFEDSKILFEESMFHSFCKSYSFIIIYLLLSD